jgi:hypothetical protein
MKKTSLEPSLNLPQTNPNSCFQGDSKASNLSIVVSCLLTKPMKYAQQKLQSTIKTLASCSNPNPKFESLLDRRSREINRIQTSLKLKRS